MQAREDLWVEPESYMALNQLLGIYHGWIESQPDQASGLIPQMLDDFDKWKQLNENRPQDEELGTAYDQLRQIIVYAAIVKQQMSRKPDEQTLKDSYRALSGILERDHDNLSAVHNQMHTCWSLAVQYAKKDQEQTETCLKEAGKLANRILAESKQTNQRSDAQTVNDKLKQILKKDHARKTK